MDWDVTLNWATIIETVVIVATAACGLYKYFREKTIERRNRTIEKIGELLNEYREGCFDEKYNNERFKDHVAFLSRVEQFCIAVDSKVYSKAILKKFGSKFLCSLYHKYKNNVIAKRRSMYGEDNYIYLEKLVIAFEKKRKAGHI